MSKETKGLKKDKARFKLPDPPQAFKDMIAKQFPIVVPEGCGVAIDKLNEALVKGCDLRTHFQVESDRPCKLGGGGATSPVDLVVLIDTSFSMDDEANGLSAAADAAISAAQANCPSDLRVSWFGIEGVWSGTKFDKSYRTYLHGLGVTDADIVGTPGDFEDGAAAIMDLSDHFDWRAGTSKVIFYLGDEALEGGNPQNADDVTAANSAIATAQGKGVTIFTYAGTGILPDTMTEYARLATDTGGQAFVAPAANIGGFQAILEKVICAASGGGCHPVKIPKLHPCFELQWGDGPQDRIETDDVETLCITATNPYSNIVFKNLTVLITLVTKVDGSPVEKLPDNTPSVFTKPTYVVCFGDLYPCDEKNNEFSHVAREVMLVSRGAKEGKYLLNIAYCYSLAFTMVDMDKFEIELVRS